MDSRYSGTENKKTNKREEKRKHLGRGKYRYDVFERRVCIKAMISMIAQ